LGIKIGEETRRWLEIHCAESGEDYDEAINSLSMGSTDV